MKKLMVTVCLVLALLIMAAPMAMADTVTMRRVSGYYDTSFNGGEFTVQINDNGSPDLNWVLPLYHPDTKGKGIYTDSFQSFCVEMSEHISINSTYAFRISDTAILGGTANGDPLSRGAAWLYHQFQLGILGGYIYTPGTGRAASAVALQNAIWAFEDEGGSENAFFDAAVANFNNDEIFARGDNFHNGIRDVPVMVLNLYNADGSLAQDQMVCVPEPGILILLGIAMGAIGAASWRIRKL